MNPFSSLTKIIATIVRKPLLWLVQLNRLPVDPIKELNLDLKKPILYILKVPSSTNLALLEQQCKEIGLPSPTAPVCDDWKESAYLFIGKNSIFNWIMPSRQKRHKQRLQDLTDYVTKHPDKGVQLVPISIFWGRSPTKENSLFRVYFSDVEDAGIIRKFFIVLFQRKHTFIQFSNPVELDKVIKQNVSLEQNTRTLGRVLRVHFHRRRIVAMGPQVVERRQLINGLLSSEYAIKAIKREASSKKISYKQARKTARKYAYEFAANQSYFVVRFLDKILTWMWNKIYSGIEVHNAERLREIADEAEIIYVPCHRSHMDYLLLGYTLYRQGLFPPHIAAGINLNFWPAGPILRRGGAFFMRRSFAGNKLYTAMFNEYVHTLFSRGVSVKFFPEGGRSRTGRLLQPKTGMMTMAVNSFIRGVKRPMVLIPVNLGYEKILEGNEYLGEMHGNSKKSESVGQLLGVRKVLKRSYGKAYVNFGKPINLQDYLDEHQPDWINLKHKLEKSNSTINELRPQWLSPIVKQLSSDLMRGINEAAIVNPVNLISTVLLATERNAIDRKQLVRVLDCYLYLLRTRPYSEDIVLPDGDGEEVVSQAEKLGMLQRAPHGMGDVNFVGNEDAILLSYYRNNTLHLFVTAGLIASCFSYQTEVTEKDIIQQCLLLFPLFRSELLLRWDEKEFKQEIKETLKIFAKLKLLRKEKSTWHRADINSQENIQLRLIAETTQPLVERFVIMVSLLKYGEEPSRKQLERQSYLVAERLSIIHKINAPEFFDKQLFSTLLQSLREMGLVTGGQGKVLKGSTKLFDLFDIAYGMVRSNTKQAIQQATRALQEQHQSEQDNLEKK
jgi:glycerol-3-phosphate O-acyltransferase